MSDEAKSKDGIDAEKMVNRLLDIIKQQQEDLVKLQIRSQELVSQQMLGASRPNAVPELIQVQASDQILPYETANTRALTFSETVRRNFVFIALVGAIGLGLTILAFKPANSEVTRLAAQVAQDQETIRGQIDRQQTIRRNSDAEIILLQKKLASTEHALAENESALIQEQDALRHVLEGPDHEDAPAVTPHAVPAEHPDFRSSIAQIVAQNKNVSGEIQRNLKVLTDNLKALATTRLALYNVKRAQAPNVEAEGKPANAPEKTAGDFLTSEESSIPTDPIANGGGDVLPNSFPTAEADLRDLATKENRMLEKGEATLGELQLRITRCQNEIISAQAGIADVLKNGAKPRAGEGVAAVTSGDVQRAK